MIAETFSQGTETFTLRAATLADLPETVALFNICTQETSGKDKYDIKGYRNEWLDPGLDLAADTRLAQLADGTIVGCVEMWNTPPYVVCWLFCEVHPAYRGLGIGTALMNWAEARAAVALERAPAGARIIWQAASISNHASAIELLRDRGFAQVRYTLTMACDLGEELRAPAWPAGIRIQTMQPGGELAVYRAQDESFKDHWGHADTLEEQGFARWRHNLIEDAGHDPTLWFLAMDGAEIAGIALCDAQRTGDPDMGWVDTLGVRRPWRRRGLAQALLLHSFGELRRRGRSRVGLGVDASSLTGATRLYERAGMRPIEQFVWFERELRPGLELTRQALEL